MESIEPSASLVNTLGDEVCSAAELLAAEVAETLLCIWHRT